AARGHRRRLELRPRRGRRREHRRARRGRGPGEGDGPPRPPHLHPRPAAAGGDGPGRRRGEDLRAPRARAARGPHARGGHQRRPRGAQRHGLRAPPATRDRAARQGHHRARGGAPHLPRRAARARAPRRPAPPPRRGRGQRRAGARAAGPAALAAQLPPRRRPPHRALPHHRPADETPDPAFGEAPRARAGLAPHLGAARGRGARHRHLGDREHAGRDGGGGARAGSAAAPRRAVEALAARFAGANPHGRHVARLALALFDGPAAALGLPATARELLNHAALPHDIGHAIDHNRHHHHSCYLIRNMELVAFDPLEIEIMAQVARGHRKQVPKLADPELQALPRAARRVVRGLAALLRTADALDRTHFGAVRRLRVALSAGGFPVRFTEWNSSRLVRRAMKRGKRKDLLTPTTFSLLHAVDFADRLTYQIVPPLKAGMIVLADRYVYTAFSRDVARGVHPAWVRSVYSFAPRPDLALYFRVPIEVSLDRLLAGRTKLKYHEAGMDVGLSTDPVDSFRMFQSRVLEIYDQLAEEFGLRVVDATADIPS